MTDENGSKFSLARLQWHGYNSTMDKQTARAWVIFVIVAMVIHGIGELFEISLLTFLVTMFALAIFAWRWLPEK